MPLIKLVDCRCGKTHMLYLPYGLFLTENRKHEDPEFADMVSQLDSSELTKREIKIAKAMAKEHDYLFTDIGVDKVIFCDCGKLLDLDNLIFRRRRK